MANFSTQNLAGIVDSVSFYARVSEAFKGISEDLADQSKRIANLESDILNLFKKPIDPVPTQEAIPEAQESLSSISSRSGSRALNIAGLSAIIPLLFNEESRNYLASFLKGVIGAETLENINTALKVAAGALAGVLTYKLIKQVGDTVNSVMTLSRTVGTLFGLTEAAGEDVSDERKELGEKKKRDAERRRKIRENRVKRAKRLQKLKSVVSKVKVGGPIGFAIGTVAGIGIGVLVDLISQSDQKQEAEEDKAIENDTQVPDATDEINTDNLTTVISKNIVEQLSLGLLTWDSIKKSIQALGGDEQAAKENIKEVEGSSISGSEMEDPTSSSSSDSFSESPAKVESKSPVGPIPEVVDSAAAMETSTTQENKAPSAGTSLNSSSEDVIQTKKQINAKPTVVVNNIDNSVFVAKAA